MSRRKELHILVQNIIQLNTVFDSGIFPDRIYLDYHMLLPTKSRDKKASQLEESIREISEETGCEFYCALPYMMRGESGIPGIEDIRTIWQTYGQYLDGFLVRNLEELGYLALEGDALGELNIVCDYGMYIWNHGSADVLLEAIGAFEGCVPYELNIREIRDLLSRTELVMAMNVYGRVPMMVSAGCLRKTGASCSGETGHNHTEFLRITDRKHNRMPVMTDCRACLNVIFNSVPTSLHRQISELENIDNIDAYRIDMTVEDAGETEAVLRFWNTILDGEPYDDPPYRDYTTGHYKRGVE